MTNTELIDCLDRLKSGQISQATDGSFDAEEYKKLRNIIINHPILKTQDISFIKSNLSPKEFRSYMQAMFPHYKERREFISNKINSLIILFEETNEVIIYQETGWQKIDKSVEILLDDLNSISDRIDINEIGVRCRETIVLLSNVIYDDTKHHPLDYKEKVSDTDAKRKIDGYLEYMLKGSSNEIKRKYVKSCNDMANYLTHSSNLTKRDAKLGIMATISLIQIIKIIDSE